MNSLSYSSTVQKKNESVLVQIIQHDVHLSDHPVLLFSGALGVF